MREKKNVLFDGSNSFGSGGASNLSFPDGAPHILVQIAIKPVGLDQFLWRTSLWVIFWDRNWA